MVTDLITNQTPVVTLPRWKCLTTKRTAKQININYDIFKYYNNWYKVDKKFHYFKETTSSYILLNNFLNEKISNHFGIKNVHVQIGYFEKKSQLHYGILSENFREKDKQYQSFESLPFYRTSNLSGLHQLEHLDGDVTLLMKQMKQVMIRDFFANERDRNTTTNLVLEKNNNQYQLAPLFDNDLSLITDYYSTTTPNTYQNCLATLDLENPGTIQTLKNDPVYQEAIANAFTYQLEQDIKQLQDTIHLDINKNDIEKYQTVLQTKKEILHEQLK